MKEINLNIVFWAKWLLLFALPFIADGVYAQNSTRIRGVVTDSVTGEPIPLVNIFFPGTDVGI